MASHLQTGPSKATLSGSHSKQGSTGGHAALSVCARARGPFRRGQPCAPMPGDHACGPRAKTVCCSSPRWQREQQATRTAEQRQREREQQQAIQQQAERDTFIIWSTALGLTTLATIGFTVFRDDITDWLLDAPSLILGGEVTGLGIGDLVGGLAWGLALYFTNPLQILFLFLGKVDIERPSDWLLRRICAALGQDINDPSWEIAAPAWARVAVGGSCLATGLGIAVVLNQGLGDATWSLSTGIGSVMAGGMLEAGRPRRLSQEEAMQLETQWQDFAVFANRRLQRTGRCHESEVAAAFAREDPRYRREGAIPKDVLRDMIRNWHPGAERTPKGYYKNLSVVLRVDPFTLEVKGTPRQQTSQQEGQKDGQQEGQEGQRGQGLEPQGGGQGDGQQEGQGQVQVQTATVGDAFL